MGQKDMLSILKQKAAAVQMIVSEVEDMPSALQYAAEITVKQQGSSIAAPGIAGEELDQLSEVCRKSGLKLLTENLRPEIGSINTGLTMAGWGIAETATLVMDSTREDFRIATMLSETHVAILPKSRIVPDAMALEAELAAILKEAPRYLAFISGASRTADIERVLTIGVHGPQELHLLILEDR